MMTVQSVISVFLLCLCGANAQELLTNNGFESGTTNWTYYGFTMELETTEVHEGVASVKCSDRTETWHGPGQDVPVLPGGKYAFSSYAKLVDDISDAGPQTFMVKIKLTYSDDGSQDYFNIAQETATPADGWIHLDSDFVAPERSFDDPYLYIEGPDAGVSFYFDDTTLTEIEENLKWIEEANDRIESLRKTDVHFEVNIADSFDPDELYLEIDHIRHLFGFGAAVNEEHMSDIDYRQYQEIVYYMFNWASNNGYKWRTYRGNNTNPDYEPAIACTNALRENGLKVRSHWMFHSVQGWQWGWVQQLTGDDLQAAVDNHLSTMMDITMGQVQQWDVMNGMTHGTFFEDTTGNPEFTEKLFKSIRSSDPAPELYLGDYDVVQGGSFAQAFVDLVKKLKAKDVPIDGISAESRFPEFLEPDPVIIKRHLDLLAEADLPIWISDLDLAAYDEPTRADWYENVLRMLFSHPSVEGVILRGFWDHDIDPLHSMVHGYEYTLAEPGQRFIDLTKREWSTHVNRSMAAGGNMFDLRAFQGDYNVTVWYQGKPIQRTTISVGKEEQTFTIDVDGDGQEIMIEAPLDPFAHHDISHDVTTNNLQTLGTAISSTTNSTLQCETKWSGFSAVGDDETADVSCDDDQVMTSCSSYLRDDDFHRDGERIMISNGKTICRAVNGYTSTSPVQSIAVCCGLQGLQCTYRTAGPSGTGLDDQVEVPCEDTGYPTGCSAWTWHSESDGTLFTNQSCIAENDAQTSGIYGYAACCTAPGLQCDTMFSSPSGLEVGDKAAIQCPVGYVMTGCNVFSAFGRAGGAYTAEWNDLDGCIAINGFQKYAPEIGVQAVATCCTVE